MSSQSQTDLCESVCLSEYDVPTLMESLVEVSDKWEEIDIALHLPGHTLIDCRGKNNTLSLNNVLCEWIRSNHPQETTLETLKHALESPLVGRPRVAESMVEILTTAKKALAAKCQDSLLSGVKKLELSENNISDGAAALAKGLKSCNNLQTLELPENNISDGAAALAKGLKSCNNLQTLELPENNISDGAAALVEVKKASNILPILERTENNIGDVGAAALAEIEKASNILPILERTENNIGDVGAAALAEIEKASNILPILERTENNIGDVGAAALAEIEKTSNILPILERTENNIGNVGRGALARIIHFFYWYSHIPSPHEEYFYNTI